MIYTYQRVNRLKRFDEFCHDNSLAESICNLYLRRIKHVAFLELLIKHRYDSGLWPYAIDA